MGYSIDISHDNELQMIYLCIHSARDTTLRNKEVIKVICVPSVAIEIKKNLFP